MKSLCTLWFWGVCLDGWIFGAVYLLMRWKCRNFLEQFLGMMIEQKADRYAAELFFAQPFVVLSLAFITVISAVGCGIYLEVFPLAWIFLVVSFLVGYHVIFTKIYLPVWVLGDKIMQDRRYDKVFRALDSIEDFNRVKYKDFN